ncbi:MAG: nucleoside monophosphate kinase [Spirochaetes bacterium]|nr:nucleoside monophosphate kinase [Spirochaetota bacterium]
MFFLCLYGMPGSGKGSQAKIISKKLNLLHISTGDIIRDIIKEKKKGYEKLEEFIISGKLVPDEIVTSILIDYINDFFINKNGILFDGYPRNIKQFELLEKFINEKYNEKLINIFIKTDEEVVKKRVLGRRVCGICSKIFNIYNDGELKNCNECGGELIIRKDDSEEVFYKRMSEYNNFTKPLVEFLENKGNLLTVDGNFKTIDELSKDLIDYLMKKNSYE